MNTAEMLKDVERMQEQLKIASLQGARMIILKLSQNKDWGHKQQKELQNQAEAIQWAIDKITLSNVQESSDA